MFKEITRMLEIDNISIDKETLGVFSRWKGEETFSFAIMRVCDYNKKFKTAKQPADFTSSRAFAPCRNEMNIPKHSEKHDYEVTLGYYNSDELKAFQETGSARHSDWQPKVWMESPPEGYELTWFCWYDHFLAYLDLSPRKVAYTMLLCEESGYDVHKIYEHLKDNDKVIVSEPTYVCGNGYQINLSIQLTTEKYLEHSNGPSWSYEFETELRTSLDIEQFKSEKD